MAELTEEEKLEPGAAIAVVLRSSPEGIETLMIKRSPDASVLPGLWNCPGGHIDEYEHPHEAMMRELKEETNLTTVNFHEIARFVGPGIGILAVFFQVFVGPDEIVLNSESTEYRWFKLTDIDRDNSTPLSVRVIDLLLSAGDLGDVSVVHAENAALRKQIEVMADQIRWLDAEDPELYSDPRDRIVCTSSGPPPLKIVFVLEGYYWVFSKAASIKYGRQVRGHTVSEISRDLQAMVEGTGLSWANGHIFLQSGHQVLNTGSDEGVSVDFNPGIMQCMRVDSGGCYVCIGTLADVARHRSKHMRGG